MKCKQGNWSNVDFNHMYDKSPRVLFYLLQICSTFEYMILGFDDITFYGTGLPSMQLSSRLQ